VERKIPKFLAPHWMQVLGKIEFHINSKNIDSKNGTKILLLIFILKNAA